MARDDDWSASEEMAAAHERNQHDPSDRYEGYYG